MQTLPDQGTEEEEEGEEDSGGGQEERQLRIREWKAKREGKKKI